MGLRVNRGTLLVGILAIVGLVLALVLVPGIAAEGDSSVGIRDDPNTCWMVDPSKGIEPVEIKEGDVSIFMAPEQSSLPDEAPVDTIALLRCKTTFDEYIGPRLTILGSTTSPCRAVYADMPESQSYTYFWQQTVSTDGDSTLTCFLRKLDGNS